MVDGERLVSDEGLETLVRLANEKFQVNADRMERFREAFNAMCAKRAAAKAGAERRRRRAQVRRGKEASREGCERRAEAGWVVR